MSNLDINLNNKFQKLYNEGYLLIEFAITRLGVDTSF